MKQIVEIRHGHVFCGLGGGARGMNRGKAQLGNLKAKFRCVGGIDVDRASVADFERLSGVRGTVIDLFSRDQYVAFHGHEPPAHWREATPDDIRRAFNGERPHVGFMSPPCKGFSGLLSQKKSESARYQALNALTLRGVWLYLEAWKDDPSEFLLLENVPRIQTRGRHLLDQIIALMRAYGYATNETTHDCGELGGLAQSRKRFLLVARHMERVPSFLYQAPRKPLRAVGEVLDKFPLPGDPAAGAMHRSPALQWKTWVRLAFVEAGSDWRSLKKLRVEDGVLADYLMVPELFNGAYGVTAWEGHAPTVTSKHQPSCGGYSVADPRIDQTAEYAQLGVRQWGKPTGTVSGQSTVGGGSHAVADPRLPADGRFNNVYRIVAWSQHSPAVTAGTGPTAGGVAVADPRCHGGFEGKGKYIVTPFDAPANTVIAGSTTGNGAFAVADPRTGFGDSTHKNILRVTGWEQSGGTVTGATHPSAGALCVADPRPRLDREKGDDYLTAGHYGVVPWSSPSYAVTAHARHDNGHHNIADPRLPAASDRLVCVIRALDGTWHRPFTTLELAALQGLVDPEEHLELEGLSDSAWRERIGNAVPSNAGQAIASVMGRALLGAWSGETFLLSAEPVWVRPIAIALSLQNEAQA